MKNQKRKGFTLVELLIVIAILAVLATVSIVGYTSFIKKARQSVDEQFATQLNTILEAAEVADGKPANIAQVQELLTENNVGSFVATYSLNTFYWLGTENRVIIFTKDSADATTGKVTFPENLAKSLKDQTTVSAGWYDLATGVTFDDIDPDATDIKAALIEKLGNYVSNSVIRLPANTALAFSSTELMNNLGNKDVKIDLNGGTITHSDNATFNISNGKTLELSNGNYIAKNMADAAKAVISPQTSASVVLRNMTIETNGAAVFPAQVASEAIIDNCTIKAPSSYCVSTNASPDASKNVKIIITNSTLEGNTPVLVNVPCELEIDNCTINGVLQGVVVRGGTAVIRNSTITQECDNSLWNYFNTNKWSQGNTVNLAALTIGNKDGGYQYPSYVELYNVKLISVGNNYPACYIIGNTTEGNGATLVYDSACTFNGFTKAEDIGGTLVDGHIIKGNDSVTITKK